MNIKEIEQIYSSNNNTPAFLVLAHYYYKKKFYKHAKNICEIGLEHYPNNLDAQYIYAKIQLLQGETKKAEFFLKNIISYGVNSIQPYLLLIKVMETLNRSKKSIAAYVLLANKHYHFHPIIQKHYKTYCNKTTKTSKTTANSKKTIAAKKQHKEHVDLDFNIQLATKTMYQLYLSQKKYNAAKSILLQMQKIKQNTEFVENEIKNINKLLDKEKL